MNYTDIKLVAWTLLGVTLFGGYMGYFVVTDNVVRNHQPLTVVFFGQITLVALCIMQITTILSVMLKIVSLYSVKYIEESKLYLMVRQILVNIWFCSGAHPPTG